jgi:hypothetical protein
VLDAWLLPSRGVLAVVLMAQTHAVLDAPEQRRISTVWDDVMDFGRDHDGALMLTLETQRILA